MCAPAGGRPGPALFDRHKWCSIKDSNGLYSALVETAEVHARGSMASGTPSVPVFGMYDWWAGNRLVHEMRDSADKEPGDPALTVV